VRRYPAARFVMTHRDPTKVIASVASLHSALYEERSLPGTIDRQLVGPRCLSYWTEGMRRALAARAQIGEDRFIDVTNVDVVKYPVETFERIYGFLGMPISAALRERHSTYHRDNAPGAFGAHRYTPEEFGLDATQIRLAFTEYGDRFGV